MPITLSAKKWKNVDNKVHVQARVQGTASYLTNASETFTPNQLGLQRVEHIYAPTKDLLDPSVSVTDADTKRGSSVTLAGTGAAPLLRFWSADGTEASDTADYSSTFFTLVFVGS